MENKIKSLIKKLRRFGFSVKPRNKGNVDPVCGMEASNNLLKADYQNKSYYFCSIHCKEQFVVQPSNYVD